MPLAHTRLQDPDAPVLTEDVVPTDWLCALLFGAALLEQGFTGAQAAEYIRQHPRYVAKPIIVLARNEELTEISVTENTPSGAYLVPAA